MKHKLNLVYDYITPHGPIAASTTAGYNFLPQPIYKEESFYYHWKNAFALPAKIIPSFIELKENNFLYDFSVNSLAELYYLFENLEKNIPDHVLEKIINGNGYICFLFVYESYVDAELLQEFYNKFSTSAIPLNKVILCTNCANGSALHQKWCKENHMKPMLRVEYIGIYAHVQKDITKDKRFFKYSPSPTTARKKFLMFNRRIRDHRFIFLYYIFKKKLLDNFFISFDNLNSTQIQERYDAIVSQINYDLHYNQEQCKELADVLPLILDNQNFNKFPMENDIYDTAQLYKDSFIHIVSETNFENNQIHITEKTLKPIIFRQPFIILGPPHTLQYLKYMGFQTFEKFWNEEYDNDMNPISRMEKIIALVSEMCTWQVNKYIKLYDDTADIRSHNYRNFSKLRPIEALNFLQTYGD